VRDLHTLPKTHLHVHLESTIRPHTLTDLAQRHNITIPPVPPGGYPGFRAFADRGTLVRSCLRHPEDFARITTEFLADAAADGVRYTELTLSAGSHTERLGTDVLPAVIAALDADQHDITARLILDHSRRRPTTRLATMIDTALQHPGTVVAIGVAGDEAHPIAPFATLLADARAAGLRMVHHAGEMAGPHSIAEALTLGAADRIGHATTIDTPTLRLLREHGAAVEVCASSNLALRSITHLDQHPLPRLIAEGIPLSINLDIPDVLGTTLTAEYTRLRDHYHWDDHTTAAIATTAINSSFAPDDVKARVRADLTAWITETSATTGTTGCDTSH
jgi:adenosine deaminase